MSERITKLEYLSMIDKGLIPLPSSKAALKKMLSSFCSLCGDKEHADMVADLLIESESNGVAIIDKIITSSLSSGDFVYICKIRYRVKRSNRIKRMVADVESSMLDSISKMEKCGKIEFSEDRMKVRLTGSDNSPTKTNLR